MRVNGYGYVERRSCGKGRGRTTGQTHYREWWLIKHLENKNTGQLNIGIISFPKKYVGKKIRIKIEMMED